MITFWTTHCLLMTASTSTPFRPSFLFRMALLLACVSWIRCQPSTAEQATPPNVILIMTDDQGYGDFGFTGNAVIETPNLDALAENSAWLDRFYVSPVCTPTRACLMTGRYNYRTRAVDTYVGRAMMEPEEVTIAEALKASGYATGIFGKWHLGDSYPLRAHDQGFDRAVVHKGGGLAQPSEPFENDGRYTDPILFRNGEAFQAEGYCTDVYFEEAMRFIEAQEDTPFFTYIATNAPHGPFDDVPEALLEKYQKKDLSPVLAPLNRDTPEERDKTARVFAMIENVDQNIGKLVAFLEERGQLEHTLLMFLVDNGPNGRRYVGPFRGTKSHVHEGGIRSPFLAHWPGTLEPGRYEAGMGAHIDVMPTILEATGTATPEGVALDGQSMLPLLQGNAPRSPDRTLFIQTHRGDEPQETYHFAAIGPRWKLVHNTGFGQASLDPDTVAYELYDIPADPGETQNLAEQQPEEVERLLAAYRDWFADVSSTRPDNYAPPRIVIGTEHETAAVLTQQDWRRTAGNGWGTAGHWELEVAEAGAYQLDVLLPEPHAGAELDLRIGDERLQQRLGEGQTKVTFSGVSLEAGPASLEGLLKGPEGFVGGYQVVVSKE